MACSQCRCAIALAASIRPPSCATSKVSAQSQPDRSQDLWRRPGIYLIANAATQYVVNIAPGMATEVVCTFDCGTQTPLRALSVFLYPGGASAGQPPSQMSGNHQKSGKG